jgi:hypothetical protein
MFSINQSSGEIAVVKKLDREMVPRYEMLVRAEDNGNPPRYDTALVNIVVRDINDNSPIFSPSTYSANVDDSTPIGHTVLRVICLDKDEPMTVNSALRYRIVSGQEPNSTFQVTSNGDIVLVRRLDFYRRRSYNISIQASDSGLKPLTSRNNATVLITVITQKFLTPKFESSRYSFYVNEDITVPHFLGRIYAVYFNPLTGSDDLVYNIKSGNSGGNFYLSSSGNLTVINSLDRETDPQFVIEVSATDSQNRSISVTTVVQIMVIDVNDNYPNLLPSGSVDVVITETADIYQPLVVFNCTDNDSEANNTVRLSLVNTTDMFILSNNSILLKQQPVISSNTTINLTMQCLDSGHPQLTSQAQVQVHIIKVNLFNPTFSSDPYLVGIKEDKEVGTSVYTVHASDDDRGQYGEIEYSLRKSNGVFTIDPVNGIVYTAQLLDRERHGEYMLEVVATDKGVPPRSGTAKLTIKVLDVNDNGPQCEKAIYRVNVLENAYRVVDLNCTDHDEKGVPMYSVLDASDPDVFVISTGVVMVNQALNQRASTTYSLLIQVFDPDPVDVPAVNVTVLIHVNRSNDYSPVFSAGELVNLHVADLTVIGTTVAHVSATDNDLGPDGEVEYSLVGGTGTQKFAVNSTDGGIHLIQSLAKSRRKSLTLIIEATDQSVVQHARRTATAEVTILVFRTNPVLDLQKHSVSVDKSVQVGTTVVQANCSTSNPTSGNLTFRLEAEVIESVLSINSHGTVKVKALFDIIQYGNYSVVVVCEDSNSHFSKASFILTVFNSATMTPSVMTKGPSSSAITVPEKSTLPVFTTSSPVENSKAAQRPDSSEGVLIIIIGSICGFFFILLLILAAVFFVKWKQTHRSFHAADKKVRKNLNNELTEVTLHKVEKQKDIEMDIIGKDKRETSSSVNSLPASQRPAHSLPAIQLVCSRQDSLMERVIEEEGAMRKITGRRMTEQPSRRPSAVYTPGQRQRQRHSSAPVQQLSSLPSLRRPFGEILMTDSRRFSLVSSATDSVSAGPAVRAQSSASLRSESLV